MKHMHMFLTSFIRSLFHPVVLISLFGPLILFLNLTLLRDALNLPYSTVEVVGEYTKLKGTLSDIWSYALIDYNIQLYTLMLAWIIFFVEVSGLSISLFRRHGYTGVVDSIKSSTSSLLFVIGIVLLFLGGIWLFISGTLSTPETVSLYLPEEPHLNKGIRIPPLESKITLFRGVIVFFGFVLPFWEQNVLPEILKTKN